MGIEGLNRTIKDTAPSVMSYITLDQLPKGLYGVDVSIYLHPAKYRADEKGKGSHIRIFMDMITQWREAGHGLVMVFDGNTSTVMAKQETISKRKAQRQKKYQEIADICQLVTGNQINGDAESNDGTIYQIAESVLNNGRTSDELRLQLEQVMKNNIQIQSTDFTDLRKLFDLTGTPYLQAQGEADHLLADLYKHKYIHGVISEDGDMLTHGIGNLVRGLIDPFCRSKGMVKHYNLNNLLNEWKITQAQFIDVCILAGSDYCPKIKGIACKTALKLISKHGSVTTYLNSLKNHDGVPEDYLTKYQLAFSLFNETQEKLPDQDLWQLNFKLSAPSPDLKKALKTWLMDMTNYQHGTIDKKIESLSNDILQAPSVLNAVEPKQKLKVKVNVNVKKVKVPAKVQDKDNVSGKVKLKVPVKGKVKVVPVKGKVKVKN